MKKLLSFALSVLMLASVFTTGVSAYIMKADVVDVIGDANLDGEVNAKDRLTIQKHVAKIEEGDLSLDADANGDGTVNAKDAFSLKAYLSGAVSSLTDNEDAEIERVVIDGANIKDFVITYPSDANKNVLFAVGELHDYILRATGYDLPTVADSTAENRFVFATDAELGDEGVDIKVENGTVYLTGGELRGCMYAAYEFLERYLGWVFYNIENEYVHAGAAVVIEAGSDYHHVPKITDRDSQTWSYQAERIESALKVKITSWKNRGTLERSEKYGYGVGYVGTAHTMADYAPTYVPGNFSKTEWSSEDLYLECFENVLKKIEKTLAKGNPCPRISVSPMDNNDYCTCRFCAKINKAEKTYMGAQLKTINRLAEEIAEYYPEVHILTTAYWYARKPPETLVPNDNVDILFCWAGCNNHPFDGSDCYEAGNRLWYNNIKERDYFEKWCEICDTVYVWIYSASYTGALAQPVYIDHLKDDVKFLADHGVYGIYCEGFYGTSNNYKDGNCFDLLTAYLFAKCMYDPDMSDDEYDKTIDEFLLLYYGKGWEYVKQFMNMNIEATNALGKCSANNCDVIFDQTSLDYYTEHAEEIFEAIDTALAMAETEAEIDHMEHIAASAYWLCLVGTADYMNGTPDEQAVYAERYKRLHAWVKKYPITNLDDEQGRFNPDDNTVMNPYAWNTFSIYHHNKEAKDPMATFD